MVSTFLFAALLAQPLASESIEATEDVWVYSHASDPGGDSALRIFGNGGHAVAGSAGDLESFSYGYLKFDLSGLPKGKKLTSAELILTPAGKPVVDPASKDWPLEVRPMVGSFAEKTWAFEMASDVTPSKDSVYGNGVIKQAGDTFEIRMNLLGEKSKFTGDLGKLIDSARPLFVALTSKYDASEQGMKGMYKVYSRDNKERALRPRLELKFAD